MKTPISYYGGKQRLLSKILPLLPKHRIYTEVFFGGGAVFFGKPKSEVEVINDNNGMVVNFFEVAKTQYLELKLKIEATLFSRATYMVALAIYRMPHLFGKVQRAWAFYVATNMGFACNIGSWGYDKYGKRLKTFLNKKLAFDHTIPDRLEKTQIECNKAIKVIKAYDSKDTFNYIDPPYIKTDMGHYANYTEDDYRKLLDCLSSIKGTFLLSSFPSEMLDEYIKKNGWYSIAFTQSKSAVHAKYRTKDTKKIEVLTANYPVGRGAN